MGVKVDTGELEEFAKNVARLGNDAAIKDFMEACAKELAARLLAKVIKRTPVGKYPASTGLKGGTLRRGWTGGKRAAGGTYVESLSVDWRGDEVSIEIVNPVEYAPYVEYGHRTRNGGGKGWVEGRFMLTISTDEIQQTAPAILQRKILKKLGEIFGDN